MMKKSNSCSEYHRTLGAQVQHPTGPSRPLVLRAQVLSRIENLVLWARSKFNGFTGKPPGDVVSREKAQGSGRKAQGEDKLRFYAFALCPACPVEFPLCGTSVGGFHRVNLKPSRTGATQSRVLWAWVLYSALENLCLRSRPEK